MRTLHYTQHEQLLLAVDCVIFGFDGTRIKALLMKRDFEPEVNCWSLIGGFVKQAEGVNDAAKRVLFQLAGFENVYVEQLGCFGDVDRDPGGRVISIVYFALIKINDNAGQFSKEHDIEWIGLDELPLLILDHNTMIERAKQRLKEKIENHLPGLELLGDKFTIQQLQFVYEAI